MELTVWMIDYVDKMGWDEDIKQDVLLKLIEMDEKEITKAYIASIYHNLRTNEYNIECRRKEIVQDNIEQIRRSLGMEDEAPDPSDIIYSEQVIRAGLDNLTAMLREVVERVILGGETPEELAAEQGTTPNVIYQRVWQAKQKLEGSIS